MERNSELRGLRVGESSFYRRGLWKLNGQDAVLEHRGDLQYVHFRGKLHGPKNFIRTLFDVYCVALLVFFFQFAFTADDHASRLDADLNVACRKTGKFGQHYKFVFGVFQFHVYRTQNFALGFQPMAQVLSIDPALLFIQFKSAARNGVIQRFQSFETSFNPRGLYRGAGSRGLNRSFGFFWHRGNSFHSVLLASQGYSSSWSGGWPKNFSLTIWDSIISLQFHFIFCTFRHEFTPRRLAYRYPCRSHAAIGHATYNSD